MLLKNKIEIETWLKLNYIKNYELIEDNEYEYVVNVNNHVDLLNRNLKSIDVKFNIVYGGFNCSNNKLKSLVGCPEIVKGYFSCMNNQLISLEGCSKIVEGFFCCSNNKLKTLDFMPETINNSFYCSHNLLTFKSLNKLFDIYFNNNLIHLDGNPELGFLQDIKNFKEVKKILTVYQEKNKLDLLINNKHANLINEINKI